MVVGYIVGSMGSKRIGRRADADGSVFERVGRMIIQYCSDLHLEFSENEAWLKLHSVQPAAEVLILSGDVVPFAVMNKYAYFFDRLASSFEAVYWLPGNHEYYGGDIARRSGSFKEAIRSNVWLLNNEIVQYGEATIIFSTLWSAISPAAEWEISGSISDYRAIRQSSERFRPLHSNQLHQASLSFIKEAVAAASGKIIVATHHVPTLMHYPQQYKGSVLNEAFATELFDFIDASTINCWIYGHHHSNTPEFEIGGTKMLTNQLGYVAYGEHQGFNPAATVTL